MQFKVAIVVWVISKIMIPDSVAQFLEKSKEHVVM